MTLFYTILAKKDSGFCPKRETILRVILATH